MFVSKHYHLQEILFGKIVFEDDFHKIKKLNDDIHHDVILMMVKYIKYLIL
jgi:hypothetical protein